MTDQNEKRLSWLAFVFDAAIKHGVFRPADVVVHANAEVLAHDLPKELLIRIFEVSFENGKLTPEGILGVAPPSTLVKHIAPSILWEVVRDAAARHGITSAGNPPKTGRTPVRIWLADVLAGGLEREIFTPADVTRHIPPGEWVKDVPLEVVARMIAAGLTRPAFEPRLALEHLTPAIIGEFIAPHLSWGVLDEGAVRAFDLSGAAATSTSKPGYESSVSAAAAAGPSIATPPVPPPATELAAEAAPASEASGDWDNNVEAWVESEVVEEAGSESSSSN